MQNGLGLFSSDIFRCPDCGAALNYDLACKGCGRTYTKRDDIYALLPTTQLPLPTIYNDNDYRTFNEILSEVHPYFYKNRNPLINWVQNAGHYATKKFFPNDPGLTLDCGCGTGAHLWFNKKIKLENYVMLDIDEKSLQAIKETAQGKHIGAIVNGTAYRLPFKDSAFDTVISVAQLEHLCHLDWSLCEIRRVMKDGGRFIASVPAEGGLLWPLGRSMTSARHFSKKLGINYIRAMRIEHFNTIHQVDHAIRRYFKVQKIIFFPFRVPSFNFNLVCTYILYPL